MFDSVSFTHCNHPCCPPILSFDEYTFFTCCVESREFSYRLVQLNPSKQILQQEQLTLQTGFPWIHQ